MLAQLNQFVSDVQCRHHGDAIDAGGTGMLADFAHLAVEVARRRNQAGTLLRRAADEEFPIQDADRDRPLAAHAPFSRERKRAIIASTRVRACSFFASRSERSAAS